MVIVVVDREEFDMDEFVGGKEDIERECFCIWFSYLKFDKEVVKNCFVDKLLIYIIFIDKIDKKGRYKMSL